MLELVNGWMFGMVYGEIVGWMDGWMFGGVNRRFDGCKYGFDE